MSVTRCNTLEDDDCWRAVMAMSLLGACWLAAHPYLGIWHDARLYAFGALARLNPGVFDRDLFLAYGSQGQYTLFTPIFAWLIELAGLTHAGLILALAGKLLWLAGLVALARASVDGRMRWLLGAALVLGYPSFYDSDKVFSYAESFATPRIYAEALTLFALAAWLKGLRWGAVALTVAAGALHPLMAVPGVVAVAWMLLENERHRSAALAAIAILAIAVLVGWHDRLFAVYDRSWSEAVVLRNPYVFLDQWEATAFGRALFLCVVLGLAARRSDPRLQVVARATLVTAIVLMAVAWIGASLWKNVLLTQLQLWRVLWLTQIVALLMLAGLLPRLWRGEYPDRLLAACLAAALLIDTWGAGALAVAGLMLRAMLLRAGSRIDTDRPLWRLLPWFMVLPWLLMHFVTLAYWVGANATFLGTATWRTFLGDQVVLLAILGAAGLTVRRPYMSRTFGMGMAVLLLLGAVAGWVIGADERPGSGERAVYRQLQRDIPPGAVVAGSAGGGVEFMWFTLGRASYVSQLQTAGALFNRNTALEGVRRLELLRAAGFPGSALAWGKADAREPVPLTRGAVAELCEDPVLDFVLAGKAYSGAKLYYTNGRTAMSLFACRDFRR